MSDCPRCDRAPDGCVCQRCFLYAVGLAAIRTADEMGEEG